MNPNSRADYLWRKAMDVVESKEPREFILCCHDYLTERDLPHQKKLIEFIFKAYEEEHRKLLGDFKVSGSGHCHDFSSLAFLNNV